MVFYKKYIKYGINRHLLFRIKSTGDKLHPCGPQKKIITETDLKMDS